MKKCPWCNQDYTPVRPVANSKILHDVRLNGLPSSLIFTTHHTLKCHTPYCKKNGHLVSGMRLPCIEASTQSDWTLRLLASCLDLSSKGIAYRVLAEGYALKENSTRKRITQFSAFLEKEHEKRLAESLPLLRKPRKVEPLHLKEENFWAVFENGRLYNIISDELAQKMDAFLMTPSSASSSFVHNKLFSLGTTLCTFAGIGEHRTNLATMEFTLLSELANTGQSQELLQQSRDLLFQLLLEKHIPQQKLLSHTELVLLSLPGIPTRQYQTTKRIAKQLSRYLKENDSWINFESTSGSFDPPGHIRNYMWNHTDHPYPISSDPFIKELEAISIQSGYTAKEQISRLLYLNQVALIGHERGLSTSNPDNEYIWPDYENENHLTISPRARIGSGIPVDCLRYMLSCGLWDDNNGTPILCVRRDSEGRFKRTCGCKECPLGLAPSGYTENDTSI